jgi:hypothetical protein
LLCLLLWVPLSIVWRFYGPLNDAEQRLVGTWRSTAGPPTLTFHPDRTVTTPGFPRGVWSLRRNSLYSSDSLLEALLLRSQSSELTFEDDGSISLANPANGATSSWQRVAAGSSSAN